MLLSLLRATYYRFAQKFALSIFRSNEKIYKLLQNSDAIFMTLLNINQKNQKATQVELLTLIECTNTNHANVEYE